MSDLIRNYINKNNINYGDYLFSVSTLSRFVSKMSKEIGYDVTINTLRHMAISKVFEKARSLEERQTLAREFGHSIRTQEEYRGTLKEKNVSPIDKNKRVDSFFSGDPKRNKKN